MKYKQHFCLLYMELISIWIVFFFTDDSKIVNFNCLNIIFPITNRIRMKQIKLLAYTRNGAIKLDASEWKVELTNRVTKKRTNRRNLDCVPNESSNAPHCSVGLGARRPSNLPLRAKGSCKSMLKFCYFFLFVNLFECIFISNFLYI